MSLFSVECTSLEPKYDWLIWAATLRPQSSHPTHHPTPPAPTALVAVELPRSHRHDRLIGATAGGAGPPSPSPTPPTPCVSLLSVVCSSLALTGMTGSEVLQRVEQGYRMQRPSQDRFVCTEVLYDMMLKCWDRVPESRPTFSFLYSFFDDYFVSAEPNYKEDF